MRNSNPRESREYSIESSGLTKLVFDKSLLRLVRDKSFSEITDIKLKTGVYVFKHKISEEEYNQLTCPVYMLQGNISNPHGRIFGVIRPSINKGICEVVLELPPEFHFYIDQKYERSIGRSVNFHGNRLVCKLMKQEEEIEREAIGPNFTVILSTDSRTIFLER